MRHSRLISLKSHKLSSTSHHHWLDLHILDVSLINTPDSYDQHIVWCSELGMRHSKCALLECCRIDNHCWRGVVKAVMSLFESCPEWFKQLSLCMACKEFRDLHSFTPVHQCASVTISMWRFLWRTSFAYAYEQSCESLGVTAFSFLHDSDSLVFIQQITHIML